MRFQLCDPAGAMRELRLALKLTPNLAAAHDLLGRILVECGPQDVGLRHINHALELEPWMARVQLDRVRVQALLGNWEVAERIIAELAPAGPPTVPSARKAV